MIPRYTPAAIAAIFDEDARLQRWLAVELAVSTALADAGRIPQTALAELKRAEVHPARVAELEAEQGHDVAAFVSAVQETVGEAGRYLHLGLTSSDVVDTALATQLRDAWTVIDSDCAALETALARQAARHRGTVMVGRTHGVHAEPLTLGVKLANHYDEVRRSRGRLAAAAAEVSVGQISGAVGTHVLISPEVEEAVCRSLQLEVAAVTTQVIARDRHASFVTAMALLGATLERLATTVRLSQMTEVDELGEPFSLRQKGSSAMPHKRNPILCERICGLARTLRGYAATAMEDVALWHERDISHSSAERVILPDACALTSYSLQLATRVVSGLRVNLPALAEHVEYQGGIAFSQRVLTALIDAGLSREEAYRRVQALAAAARESGGSPGFRQRCEADTEISARLTSGELAACFEIDGYLNQIGASYRRLGLDEHLEADDDASGEAHSELAAEVGLGGGTL